MRENRMMNGPSALLCTLVGLALVGCASSSPPPHSGFISDYSKLQKDEGALRYINPKLKNYSSFVIDPVQVSEHKNLSQTQAEEVARYFSSSLAKDLSRRGFKIVNQAGPGVARIRVALTDIKQSKWYMSLHPASKLTGMGTGGASMEGEVVDSVSREQLGAVIQAGKGNQFELDTFSKLDDVKDAIDKWVKAAGDRLDQLRSRA